MLKSSEIRLATSLLAEALICVGACVPGFVAAQSSQGAGDWICPCPGGNKVFKQATPPNCNVQCFPQKTPSGNSSLQGAAQTGFAIGQAIRQSIEQQESQRRIAEELERAEAERLRAERSAREKAAATRLLSISKGIESGPGLQYKFDGRRDELNSAHAARPPSPTPAPRRLSPEEISARLAINLDKQQKIAAEMGALQNKPNLTPADRAELSERQNAIKKLDEEKDYLNLGFEMPSDSPAQAAGR